MSFENAYIDIISKFIFIIYVVCRFFISFLIRSDIGVKKEDYKYMDLAYQEAEKGLYKNNYPVGAVVVADGKVISKAYSTTKSENDERNHAECLAISKALISLQIRKDFSECKKTVIVYTTSEPCPMCMGLMIYRGVSAIRYGEIHCHLGKVFKYNSNYFNLILNTRGGINSKKHYKMLDKYKQNLEGQKDGL